MKQQFKAVKFNSGTGAKLQKALEIIDMYAEEGLILTLRQLYYQLVSQNVIPNNVREYSKLSYLLVKARMGGIVDWEAIEDRTRRPYLPYWAYDVPDALNDCLESFRLNRQQDQENYVEVWCEKDALSGVLSSRVTNEYHIRLLVNRGYSSATAMYDSAQRLMRSRSSHVLYLGDHDPSGLDMIRDIEDRLDEFGCHPVVHRLALTKDQIEEHDPPPNPAKWKDKRADKYVAEHGETCWEVDALPPKVLIGILKDAIKQLVDIPQYEAMLDAEDEEKEWLGKQVKLIKKRYKKYQEKKDAD